MIAGFQFNLLCMCMVQWYLVMDTLSCYFFRSCYQYLAAHYSKASNSTLTFFVRPHIALIYLTIGQRLHDTRWILWPTILLEGYSQRRWENLLCFCDSAAINRILVWAKISARQQTMYFTLCSIVNGYCCCWFFPSFWCFIPFLLSCLFNSSKTIYFHHKIVHTKRNVEHFRTILFQWEHYPIFGLP